MSKRARVLAALLLPPVLAACGTEKAGAPASAELQARAGESALELIYVTEVPGYEPAEQSVGVIGNDGFSAAYFSPGTGGRIQLTVDRGRLDETNCATVPMGTGAGARSGAGEGGECERDGDHWYRASGTSHEYARAYDGHVVRVGADQGAVDRETLRQAAEKAHRADNRELDAVLPERPESGEGVGADEMPERGDLPPVGDGAPGNDVGATG
ncbi:hypothetical protein [Streptomyces sp. Wb2n-11]|uniref:hypothetical protein n=1 Tax=Streptomyces sp. Wb2n-11 TaxID=1030533 RepID=UPI000AB071DC|nr:hypothetical protein [Streptomyces sp. Wb2n-11]